MNTTYVEFHQADSLRDHLAEAGMPEPVVALIVKATAQYRHLWRICETFRDAVRLALGPDAIPTDALSTRDDLRDAFEGLPKVDQGKIAILLIADYIGTGGAHGAGGEDADTDRILSLGSGRRRAMDGPAWMAAARELIDVLFPGEMLILTWIKKADQLSVVISWSGHPRGDAWDLTVSLPGDLSGKFVRSIARRAILQPLGLVKSLNGLSFDSEDASEWGYLLT